MAQPAHPPDRVHPLLTDRGRLDRMTDVMFVTIQKLLFRQQGARRREATELALTGGASADDVLQEALLALLSYYPGDSSVNWEAVAVRIARNKAIAALRRATKGRRSQGAEAGDPDDVTIVPLDDVLEAVASTDEFVDPELAFEKSQQQLLLLRVARSQLAERDRTIFFGIHFEARTRREIAALVGLTPQGVGQAYVRIAKKLHESAFGDVSFPPTPRSRTEEDERDARPRG